MENKTYQKEAIDLLVQNELAMEALYKVYARKISGFRAFWGEIAGEEKSHAAWVETLHKKIEIGLADFAERRFPVEAVRKNIEFLENKKKEAESKELGLLEALENSVHIERGLLENKFFEIFKSDSMELQVIMEALRLGTEAHLRKVEELRGQEKNVGD